MKTMKTTKTIRLLDLQEQLQKDMPGVYLRSDYSRGQVVFGIHIQASDYAIYPVQTDSVTGEEDWTIINQRLSMLIEQLRLKAIRELGLQPRLDAYDREAREYRESNRILESQLRAAKEKIGELELTIEELVNPIEDL